MSGEMEPNMTESPESKKNELGTEGARFSLPNISKVNINEKVGDTDELDIIDVSTKTDCVNMDIFDEDLLNNTNIVDSINSQKDSKIHVCSVDGEELKFGDQNISDTHTALAEMESSYIIETMPFEADDPPCSDNLLLEKPLDETNEQKPQTSEKNIEDMEITKEEDQLIEKSFKIDFDKFSNSSIFSQIQPQRKFITEENPIKIYFLNLKHILHNQYLQPIKREIPTTETFSIHLKEVEHFNINDRFMIIINQQEMLIYKWRLNINETENVISKYFKKFLEIWRTKKETQTFMRLSIYKKIPASYFLFLVRTKRIPDSVINFLLILYQSLLITKFRMIDKIFNSFLLYLNVEKICGVEVFLIKEEIHFLIEFVGTRILLDSNFEIKEIPDSLNLFKKEEFLRTETFLKNSEILPKNFAISTLNHDENTFLKEADEEKIRNDFYQYFKKYNLRSIFKGKHEFYFQLEGFSIKKIFGEQNLIVEDDSVYRIPLNCSLLILFNNKVNIVRDAKLNFIKTFKLAKIERISKFRNLLFMVFDDRITCLNLNDYDMFEESPLSLVE